MSLHKLTALEHLTTAAQAARDFVQGLVMQVAEAAAKDVAALERTKLDKAGGTLTGNLTGKYIIGTSLQSTEAKPLGKTADKVAVLDSAGWLYWRAPADLLDDMNGAQVPSCSAVSIPTTGWGSDSTAGYPKYCDITLTGVTAADRVDIVFQPDSAQAAKAVGICPVCETMAGKMRLRASAVPSVALHAAVWVTKGKG